MPLSSSDLSSSQKQALLGELRSQLGSQSYDAAVDQLGEDGLIDYFLRATAEQSSGRVASPPRIGENFWQAVVESFIYALTFGNVGGVWGTLIWVGIVIAWYLSMGSSCLLGFLAIFGILLFFSLLGRIWGSEAAGPLVKVMGTVFLVLMFLVVCAGVSGITSALAPPAPTPTPVR